MAFMDYLPQFSENVDQTGLEDPTLQQINLKRKLALADSLRNTPELQGQMVSGHYVAPSWTQSLANVANKYIGNKIAEKSMKEYSDYEKNKTTKMADILKGLTPHTEEVQLDTVQAGGMPGVMQTQQIKPDINAAIQGLTQLDPSFGAKIAEARIAKALTPKEPMKIGAGEVLLDENYKPIYSAPFKPHENAPVVRTMRMGSNEVTQQYDDKTGQWKEIARGPAFKPEEAPKAPPGYVWGKPDANNNPTLIPLAGGPADKSVNPTEQQANAFTFSNRMEKANDILNNLEGKYNPLTISAKTSSITSNIPGAQTFINTRMSSADQKAEQAQRDFVNAVLRRESGSAISQSEFDNARIQYFPQTGDSPEVKAQKAMNRKTAIEGIKKAAGSMNKPATSTVVDWKDL